MLVFWNTAVKDVAGRSLHNIFIERLWRSVRYEQVYLHDHATIVEARTHLAAYYHSYNEERLHETLGYRTLHEVYFGTSAARMSTEVMV
jgi:putative transposase